MRLASFAPLAVAALLLVLGACDRRCGTLTVDGVGLDLVDISEDKEPHYPIDGDYLLTCGKGRGDVGTPDHILDLWPDGYGLGNDDPVLGFGLWAKKRNDDEYWAVGGIPSATAYAELDRVEVGEVLSLGDGLQTADTWLFKIIAYPYVAEDESGERGQGELDLWLSAEQAELEILEINELTGCEDPSVEVRIKAAYDWSFSNGNGVTTVAEGTSWFQFRGSTTPGLDEDVELYCGLESGMGR